MTSRHVVLIALLFAGCDKAAPPGKPWLERPLATYTGNVEGVGFTVQLPAGMRQRPGATEVASDDVRFDVDLRKHEDVPEFVIRTGTPWTLERYLSGNTDEIVSKTTLPDGFVVVLKSKTYEGVYRVFRAMAVDDKVGMSCGANMHETKTTPRDAGIAAADKMCRSLVVKRPG